MVGSLAAIWTIPIVVAIALFGWIFVVLRADTHPGWKHQDNPPKYEVTGGSFDAVDGGRQVMPRHGGRPIPTQADRERGGHFGYVPPQGSAPDEEAAAAGTASGPDDERYAASGGKLR
jgi:hypothetical protein